MSAEQHSLCAAGYLGVGFEADAASEQRDHKLIQAHAFGLGLCDQGGVK